jgi:hypothetical protein
VGRSPVISLEVIDHNLHDFLVIIWNAFCQAATFSMYSFLLHKRLLRTLKPHFEHLEARFRFKINIEASETVRHPALH